MKTIYYLLDLYPFKTGENRFEISTTRNDKFRVICRDKSRRNLEESKESLLNSWERKKVPEKDFTPLKGPFLCVTGHSRKGHITHYQPWYQIKAEVEARGIEFAD